MHDSWRGCRGDAAEVGGTGIPIRIAKISMIENVERLCAELHAHPFADRKLFEQSEVEIAPHGATQDIAPGITECAYLV